MLALFRALLDRLKALLLSDAVLDLEVLAVSRAAERKAELLRQAAVFEAEGLSSVAADLRRQAESLDLTRPLGSVWPGLMALTEEGSASPRINGTACDGGPAALRLPEQPGSPPARRSGRASR